MIDWLIKRAMRTPYFHLEGYMERYWLVPYRQASFRTLSRTVHDDGKGNVEGFSFVVSDGTGPVSFWRRPIAWCFQRLGIAIRVHHILRSDEGRDPHDHPWPFVTVILRGGYYEHRFDKDGAHTSSEWHGAGSILFRRAAYYHMLETTPDNTAWTLFITGPKVQKWGFKPLHQPKIPYDQYLKD